MDYNKFENNLVLLLKIFSNRPNHLSKFLMDNGAFSRKFISLIVNSSKLNEIDLVDAERMDFRSYEEMDNFYTQLIDEEVDKEQMENDLNDQLFELIQSQKFEEAAILRDYMIKKKISIKL